MCWGEKKRQTETRSSSTCPFDIVAEKFPPSVPLLVLLCFVGERGPLLSFSGGHLHRLNPHRKHVVSVCLSPGATDVATASSMRRQLPPPPPLPPMFPSSTASSSGCAPVFHSNPLSIFPQLHLLADATCPIDPDIWGQTHSHKLPAEPIENGLEISSWVADVDKNSL